MRNRDSAVFVYSGIQAIYDNIVLDGCVSKATEANFVLGDLSGECDMAELKETTLIWKEESQWLLNADGCRTREFSDLLGDLVGAGAYPTCLASAGYRAQPHQQPDLHFLMTKGLVYETHDSFWRLTTLGFASASLSKRIHTPLAVFAVRDRLPLANFIMILL